MLRKEVLLIVDSLLNNVPLRKQGWYKSGSRYEKVGKNGRKVSVELETKTLRREVLVFRSWLRIGQDADTEVKFNSSGLKENPISNKENGISNDEILSFINSLARQLSKQ